MKQEAFWKSSRNSHGGESARGRRKAARPIVTKSPMHVTVKSSRARGGWSFQRHGVERVVHEAARRWRIRIRGLRVMSNHVHVVSQAASRREMQNFLRELPNKIAALVTGAKRGRPIGKFWDHLVHTRIVRWGRDYFGMKQYLTKNELEACGAPRALVDNLFARIRKQMREAPA